MQITFSHVLILKMATDRPLPVVLLPLVLPPKHTVGVVGSIDMISSIENLNTTRQRNEWVVVKTKSPDPQILMVLTVPHSSVACTIVLEYISKVTHDPAEAM